MNHTEICLSQQEEKPFLNTGVHTQISRAFQVPSPTTQSDQLKADLQTPKYITIEHLMAGRDLL